MHCQTLFGRCFTSFASIAVGVTGLSAIPQHCVTPVSCTPPQLAALITPANSTAQIFASSNYYERDWSAFGQPQVVPFIFGPQGIVEAIDNNANDPSGVVVLSSGWGAGQTGTALATMQAGHDSSITSVQLAILDNDTNRAGGGFWTTYWMVAPLLATSAALTPSDTAVPVVDTAYEYNINSDAPTYPINLLADANSLAAYLEDYGGQASAPVPNAAVQPVAPGDQHFHYIVAPDGAVTQKVAVPDNITYVTFSSGGLPLLKPFRLLPGGNILADALEPALTVLVNWGYQDNSPIPEDPTTTRPVGLLPPLSQSVASVAQFGDGLRAGLQAVKRDLSSLARAAKVGARQRTSSITAGTTGSGAVADRMVATKRRNTLSAGGATTVSASTDGVSRHARFVDTAPKEQHRERSAPDRPRAKHHARPAADAVTPHPRRGHRRRPR
jgi:hypothetical protein